MISRFAEATAAPFGRPSPESWLADAVRLPYGILEPIIAHMRVEQLVEVKSAAGTGTAGYRYSLTDKGRDRAGRCLHECAYVGPAPVPLDQYLRHMSMLAAWR